jgi:hypothetical protein
MTMLLVSTRKGLFEVERTAAGLEVTRGHFLGDNVSLALADPRGGWYAALDHGHFGVKLHRSDDRGATWTEIATPAYPKQPDGTEPEKNFFGAELKWSTSLIWSLVPALDADGALWCGTIPGGLFRSDDRGASWRLVEALWFHPDRKQWGGGGRDFAGIHSICVDPRDPRTVAVGVSIGGIWRTRDAGATWTQCASGMRAEYVPPERVHDGLSQDVHCLAQCASAPHVWWVQHHNGIFRSTDDMATWTEIERGSAPSVFGFPVVADPADPETAWFVPAIKDEKRTTLDGKLVVARTRDGGKTFDRLDRGLPPRAYDLVYRHAFTRTPDGTLAFGSTTGNVFASTDGGEVWSVVSNYLPPVYAITAT